MSAVLQLRGVWKRYPGDPPVESLRDVSLTIEEGELLAVVGPSGSGKTTLLHVMGTLDRPTQGDVRVAGHAASGLSDVELSGLRAHHLGFVFQQFFLLEGVSVLDNVANGLLYRGLPLGERRRRAREALDRVGLSHRLSHRPTQLSGGERQRVAIGRAVVGRPAIVFADEPTGNLDTAAGATVVGLLKELNRDGTTIAVITHNQEVAAAMDRRVELRDGCIVSDTGAAR